MKYFIAVLSVLSTVIWIGFAGKINKIQLVFVVPADSSLFTTQIISNRKLKVEEEDRGDASETEIKGSGSELAGNEEGSKDRKRRDGKERKRRNFHLR
jgi:hypothetical protein